MGKPTLSVEKEARGMKWTQPSVRRRASPGMELPVIYSSSIPRDPDKETLCPEGN